MAELTGESRTRGGLVLARLHPWILLITQVVMLRMQVEGSIALATVKGFRLWVGFICLWDGPEVVGGE